MDLHDLWHVAVLGITLLAAATVAIVVLGPLVFDDAPLGSTRARSVAVASALVAGALLVAEWRGVH